MNQETDVSWQEGPGNFRAKIDADGAPFYAVGESPTFEMVQPSDGFSISFQFNPESIPGLLGSGNARSPGIYFVESDGSDPPEKTRALRFVVDRIGGVPQFVLMSSTGDQFVSPELPSFDKQYEINLEYQPASQTINIKILRQDGSTLVDQRGASMKVSNPFDQVLIGEVSDDASGTAEIHVDDIQVHTNAPAPPPPEKFLASASYEQMVLSWLAGTASDVAGYNVYRSTQSFDDVGLATKVNESPLGNTRFANTGLNNGTTYYYRATTVDTDGNESRLSAEMSAVPQNDGTVVYEETFDDDPGYTVVYSSESIQVDAKASWEGGPGNFRTKVVSEEPPFYAVGESPTFPTVQPADSFSISFQFNPESLPDFISGNKRTPGIYFVDSGEGEDPTDKLQSLKLVVDRIDGPPQFRLISSNGDEFDSPGLPSLDEQYEINLEYQPASQTINVEILRQDGTPLVDNQDVSMEISNPFDQVLIGEISDEQHSTAEIHIDDIQIQSGAVPPGPLSGLSAKAADGKITLDWDGTTNPDLYKYWVYRGTTAEFDTSSARIAVLGRNTTQYSDTGVTNGETYYYRLLGMDQFGFLGDFSLEVSATPKENLVAAASATVSSDSTVDLGATGVDIAFTGVDGSGTVTVEKFSDAPDNVDGISESNVSAYRHVITADGDLTFGTNTEVRLDVGTLDGISDASNVTIYKRPDIGTGSFSGLTTNYDTGADELVATTGSFSEFALASDTEPLPVELASFEARRLDNRIQLSWQTVSEQNNARFEIQRKTRQSSSWSRVATQEGAGTTTEPQRYQFTDENLPYEVERFSYRLKQVNTDGTASFSDSVQVEIGAPGQVELRAPFPNPATSRVTIRYAIPEDLGDQQMQLVLYDVLGRRVQTIATGEAPGRNERSHQVSGLPAGTYFLRLTAGQTKRTKRFSVVR